jgi:hypothetical protein
VSVARDACGGGGDVCVSTDDAGGRGAAAAIAAVAAATAVAAAAVAASSCSRSGDVPASTVSAVGASTERRSGVVLASLVGGGSACVPASRRALPAVSPGARGLHPASARRGGAAAGEVHCDRDTAAGHGAAAKGAGPDTGGVRGTCGALGAASPRCTPAGAAVAGAARTRPSAE